MELNRELGPEETGRIKNKWSRAGTLMKLSITPAILPLMFHA